MSQTLTCIVCPMGCKIKVSGAEISGHGCARGRDWAIREAAEPVRILTTTIALEGGELALLPVRTESPVPKDKLMNCLRHANQLRVSAPVQAGQVVCVNLAGTGVKLTAARTIS